MSEESRPLFTAFLEKVFEDSGHETYEVALLQGDSEFWVSIEGAYSNAYDECSLVAMDITALKQTNKLLQNSQDHLMDKASRRRTIGEWQSGNSN